MYYSKNILNILPLLVLFINITLAQEKDTDPYIWLEEIESEKSLNWVKRENHRTREKISKNPLFTELKKSYLNIFNDKDKIAYPSIVGKYIYNFWKGEHNERGILRRMLEEDYLKGETSWEVVLDIDQLAEKEGKKWTYKAVYWLDLDSNICLVALSDGGKDENVIREFNVATKSFVENGFELEESKGSAVWFDQDHLLVNRTFGEGTITSSGYPRQVRLWKRGTKIENAEIIFETEEKSVGVFPGTFYNSSKKEALIIDAKSSYDSEIYYFDGKKVSALNFPLDASLVGKYQDELIFHLQSNWTLNNKTHRAGDLVSVNLSKALYSEFDIKTIYHPDEKSSFDSMNVSKDFIVVNVIDNIKNKLIKYHLENDKWKAYKINTPDFGSIYLVSSSHGKNNHFYFSYSNFITPTSLYYASGDEIRVIAKRKDVFDSKNLVVQQDSTISKDGTVVPYFIVHHKNMEYNGQTPTLIYAYGGFNSPELPYYSSTLGKGWLEQGGVYVLANIRGGGEYGPKWHQAAIKEKRQNAYDDFYAVTEDLISDNITSPSHLGAYGWSNGGLMAGVVFTQRPDLYNAVIVGAPLLDMKRYSKLLAGASWIGEYGDPDIPEEWEYIKKYSPYHNLLDNKKYPEVLFVTSTKDDRVHPGHARKMAAKMKDMGHNFLYHETIEGGHGGASTNEQSADMLSMMYTYLNIKLK